jgi:hypothetical protein
MVVGIYPGLRTWRRWLDQGRTHPFCAAWLFALLTNVRTINRLRAHPPDRHASSGPHQGDPAPPARSAEPDGHPITGHHQA